MKNNFARIFKTVNTQSLSAGFTLIELLVAMSLTLIVTSLSGFGLVAIMTNNSKAEAKTQRRTEINRALDFISDEIRMARRVNRTDTIIPNGSTVTINNVVTNAGLSTTVLGNPSTIVLYLEIPLTPTTCSGSPSPLVDKVVYAILSDTNTDSWLSPRIIRRYGRTPGIDGTIDPCSTPTGETFIDSISTNTNSNFTCTSPGVSSGTEGFKTCVTGREADIYLRSKVSNTATDDENASTKVFSRIQ